MYWDYEYDWTAPDFSVIYLIVNVVGLVAGGLVTFRGLSLLRLSKFVATSATLSFLLVFMANTDIGSLIFYGLSLVVAMVPQLHKASIFLVGSGAAVSVINSFAFLVSTLIYPVYVSGLSWWFFVAAFTAIICAAGIWLGLRALALNKTILHLCICCVGAFTFTLSLVRLLSAMGIHMITLFAILYIGGGVLLTFAGKASQSASLLDDLCPSQLPVATPVTTIDAKFVQVIKN